MIKINYMPFTFLSDTEALRLVHAVGPLTILQPSATTATPFMRILADQGALHLRPCPMIDAEQLERAVAAFSNWADLHNDRSTDLAGFFKSGQAQAARSLEESPNLIRTHVNRQGKATSEDGGDPLLQAALFLSLADTYDRQQAAINQDWGSVQVMEERLGVLLGDPKEDAPSSRDSLLATGPGPGDRGAYLTRQRLRAWAKVAHSFEVADGLYLTNSQAVWDQLLEELPEAIRIGQWPLPSGDPGIYDQWQGIDPQAVALLELLGALAQDPEPQNVDLSRFARSTDSASEMSFTLYAITGCPPQTLLSRLSKDSPTGDAQMKGERVAENSLIGFIGL